MKKLWIGGAVALLLATGGYYASAQITGPAPGGPASPGTTVSAGVSAPASTTGPSSVPSSTAVPSPAPSSAPTVQYKTVHWPVPGGQITFEVPHTWVDTRLPNVWAAPGQLAHNTPDTIDIGVYRNRHATETQIPWPFVFRVVGRNTAMIPTTVAGHTAVRVPSSPEAASLFILDGPDTILLNIETPTAQSLQHLEHSIRFRRQ